MTGSFDRGIWKWTGNYNNLMKLGNLVLRVETGNKPNDGLVPDDSALLVGTNQQPVQNCDHFQFLDPTLLPAIASFISALQGAMNLITEESLHAEAYR